MPGNLHIETSGLYAWTIIGEPASLGHKSWDAERSTLNATVQGISARCWHVNTECHSTGHQWHVNIECNSTAFQCYMLTCQHWRPHTVLSWYEWRACASLGQEKIWFDHQVRPVCPEQHTNSNRSQHYMHITAIRLAGIATSPSQPGSCSEWFSNYLDH